MKNLLLEMATIAKNLFIRKDNYYMQLNGQIDRIYPPHIHFYKDSFSKNKFTVEINLGDYLEDMSVHFCRIKDNKVEYKNHNECLKYKLSGRFIDLFIETIKSKSEETGFTDCRNVLEAALRAFANEADMN